MSGTNTCGGTSQITIPVGPAGASGLPGGAGANGTDGQDGIFGGWSGRWLFDATTSVAPLPTFLKFNSTILSNVTLIDVNDLNADSIDFNNFLASFINSGSGVDNFGLIKIWKRFDSNTFLFVKVTASTDGGATRSFTVEHVQSNGVFLANDELVLNFTPNGINASQDKEVLHSDQVVISNDTALQVPLKTFTIPSNTLLVDGDQLRITTTAGKTGSNNLPVAANLVVAGNAVTIGAVSWLLGKGARNLLIEMDLTRINSTFVFMTMKSWIVNAGGTLVPSFGNTATLPFTSSSSNTITLSGAAIGTVGYSIDGVNLIIKKFDK